MGRILKGPLTLHRLRTTFAILIAFSLTLAPITTAWAAAQMSAVSIAVAPVTSTSPATSTSNDAMSDCMKAMQSTDQSHAQGQVQEEHCPCCDVPSMSPCLDVGACLAKCSSHMTAVLWPVAEGRRLLARRHYSPTDLQEPPDWAFAPTAPPPRA